MFTFNRSIICSTLTLVMAFSSAAFATEGERSITLQEDVAQADLIKLDIPVGEVDVVGTTGTGLTAVVTAVCQKENRENCYQLLKELGWKKRIGSVTELELSPDGITRYDDITLKVKIGVPKDKKLDVNLNAGELRISDTSACLTAEVNAGELNIKLKENQFASAALSAKVGDAKVITPKGETIEGERSLLVGANATWKGTGSCYTKASVLAGEVQLILN